MDAFGREGVVVIPTGSLEQHGPAMPLFTDALLVTAVAESVEANLPDQVLLTPTLWLGASGHHLRFSGTLSADFDCYMAAIESVVESLLPHGFHKFYVLNGHGGNKEPNGMVMRTLKAKHIEGTFAQTSYYEFAKSTVADVLTGPLKELRHACEAETSLMLYLQPELVRTDRLRDDGLAVDPPVTGLVHHFDEITEQGSYGYATHASAEKGKIIFDASVDGVTRDLAAIANGYFLRGL